MGTILCAFCIHETDVLKPKELKREPRHGHTCPLSLFVATAALGRLMLTCLCVLTPVGTRTSSFQGNRIHVRMVQVVLSMHGALAQSVEGNSRAES